MAAKIGPVLDRVFGSGNSHLGCCSVTFFPNLVFFVGKIEFFIIIKTFLMYIWKYITYEKIVRSYVVDLLITKYTILFAVYRKLAGSVSFCVRKVDFPALVRKISSLFSHT